MAMVRERAMVMMRQLEDGDDEGADDGDNEAA